MPNIEMIAQYMKNHPDAKIEIKGYASPEGSKELNQKLSEARANACLLYTSGRKSCAYS